MAHRSGERRPAPPPEPERPEYMVLAPRRAEVRIRPLPQRRPPRFRIRLNWLDLLCIALIAVAAVALYAHR